MAKDPVTEGTTQNNGIHKKQCVIVFSGTNKNVQSKTHRQSSATKEKKQCPTKNYVQSPMILVLARHFENSQSIGTALKSSLPHCFSLVRLRVHIGNIRLLKLIKSGQCTCSSHSSQDIGTSALEKGWHSLILQNLHRTVQ